MSTLAIHNSEGKAVGEVQIPDAMLEREKGAQPVKEAVVAYLANQRQGTACTKTKGEVAGSGSKPWRQKGTGRARAGYRQSPVWRGGGVVFGPKPRSHRRDMNRKTSRLALRRALTEKIDAGTLKLVESLTLSAPKTRELAGLLKKLGTAKTVLIVTEQPESHLILAARNIPGIEVTTASLLNVYQVLRHVDVVMTGSALDALKQRLGFEEVQS
ncbi:MAG: 50S ribosomal protein L4 [Verrucomicrobia bacterium]|nr:50S ribosomal protein L4 [Kiritimatiellia bacterium]MCP5487350.1 50S ribosomal protein L4 [Verrucomicrobiota bacterium]